MKTKLTKTYYSVRVKGDGQFDWFEYQPRIETEEFYDPDSLESAQAYAREVDGFVVLVTETTVDNKFDL